jgi:hypothetical protein
MPQTDLICQEAFLGDYPLTASSRQKGLGLLGFSCGLRKVLKTNGIKFEINVA